jgi:hypothetical protein
MVLSAQYEMSSPNPLRNLAQQANPKQMPPQSSLKQ